MQSLTSSSLIYKLPQDILYGQGIKSKVHCLRGPTNSILTEDAVYSRSETHPSAQAGISVYPG